MQYPLLRVKCEIFVGEQAMLCVRMLHGKTWLVVMLSCKRYVTRAGLHRTVSNWVFYDAASWLLRQTPNIPCKLKTVFFIILYLTTHKCGVSCPTLNLYIEQALLLASASYGVSIYRARNKMAAILQTTFSNAYHCIQISMKYFPSRQ